MGAMIDKLWETDFEFSNYYDENTKELLSLYNGARTQLEATLSKKQMELFDEVFNYLSEYNAEIEKKAFSNGFSLGIRTAAEAFVESAPLIDE